MPFELATDIGGTFTDVVLREGDRQFTVKVLTTYDDPARGVMEGIEAVLAESGRAPEEARLVLHGTTLATNALIERRGAVTALLTTTGHRDALEMALENRFEQYDVNIDRPAPLVPRYLRLPVRERLDYRGRVLVELDLDSVREALPVLDAHQVTSVAVGLLHSYANPDHERKIRELLSELRPDLSVSLSSEVCPEIREYERLSTTCANAYVKPLMARYLGSLAEKLAARGFRAPVLLMTSGGGLTTLEAARAFPIRLVESGPAGGAILAARLAEAAGLAEVLSFDMGGTTAKLSIIDDGQPLCSRAFEVDRSYRFRKGSGLPIRIPVIEMVEIGAGGGSIAWVDAIGRLQVGPESAGSEPGPACYGRGGERPTVTDADLVLGKLDPDHFAGGRFQLDEPAALKAIERDVAEPLALEPAAAALAVAEIVNENMAAAARAHLGEWGRGSRGRTLIAFGGAAPLHACHLARKLKIQQVLVPEGAGVGSAIGFLLAPVAFEVVRSYYMRLEALDAGAIRALMEEMRSEALAVVGAVAGKRPLVERRRAFMRYRGQGYEIAVDLPNTEAPVGEAELRRLFEENYAALYGRVIPGLDVEILSWTLSLAEAEPRYRLPGERFEPARRPPPAERVQIVDVGAGTVGEAGCFERPALEPGDEIDGPALIREAQTTVVVAAGFSACVGSAGSLLLRDGEAVKEGEDR